MISLFSLAFFVVEGYRITTIHKVLSGADGRFMQRPLWVLRDGDQLVVIDRAAQVWVLNLAGDLIRVFGGFGEGEAQLRGRLTGAGLVNGQVWISGDNGHEVVAFDLDGLPIKRLRSDQAWDLRYVDPNGQYVRTVLYKPEADERETPFQVRVYWRNRHGTDYLRLAANPEAERISRWGYQTVRLGRHLLVFTGEGIKRRIFYRLLDLKSGNSLTHGEVALADPRSAARHQRLMISEHPDETLRLTAGATSSPELGFVITEETIPFRERYLKCFDPNTMRWEHRQIYCGDEAWANLSFFQHLKGDTWLAYSPRGLVVFDLKPDPKTSPNH